MPVAITVGAVCIALHSITQKIEVLLGHIAARSYPLAEPDCFALLQLLEPNICRRI
jgi:hypothetical protein